jgi:general secretion pathway protein E
MRTHLDLKTINTKQWAESIGLEFLDDFSKCEYINEKITPLPYSFVHKNLILPLGFEDGYILIAISNPYDLEAIKEARFLLKKQLKEVLAPKEVIQAQIELLYSSESQRNQYLDEEDALEFDLENQDKEYDLLQESTSSGAISYLNKILLEAIRLDASDIHFEPTEKSLLVKFRIDGILFEKHELPKGLENQIITRLKVQAELDIAESRMPQDGRIKLKMGSKNFDFRLSSVPVIFGERIVLRISDNSEVLFGLDTLNLKRDFYKQIQSDIRRNQGIILVTGPTGSGKTKTLYCALSEICSGDLNIMTIEDPVENKLANMAQINVNHKRGLTFSKGLKHILRQDPDVIMIGEIRDKETVDIAIEASLTGHLVLSTLHTNDAPSTIIRLIDMGIEPYLISSSLIAICSQRLVRKICTHCNNDEKLKISCQECSHSGYKGRRAIYEYLSITPKIKAAITSSVDAMTLTQIALEEGMKTLYDDGMSYVEDGTTTKEEIERVTSYSGGE